MYIKLAEFLCIKHISNLNKKYIILEQNGQSKSND
jgi:hypothetical protein